MKLTRESPLLAAMLFASTASTFAADTAEDSFRVEVRPILQEFCSDCHADGARKGDVTFDEFRNRDELLEPQFWSKVLKNVRAGIMPPSKKPQPTRDQKQRLERWIKRETFAEDPENPDPGRITVRRLNRIEYRNTIRDLLGVDFDTEKQFPPDDSGHGFDNIGDVLTLPPMLLEKYLAAAKEVVTKAVPTEARIPAEQIIFGRDFKGAATSNRTASNPNSLTLSYYTNSSASTIFQAEHAGNYQVLLDLTANERFVDNQFDYNKCRLTLKADGKELLQEDYTREGNRFFHYEFNQYWTAGPHELALELTPLTPEEKQVRSLTLRIDSITIRGPLESNYWVRPKNYERFFTKDVPSDEGGRQNYARQILEPFVQKAYRRPVDPTTVQRLVDLAEATYDQPGKSFEAAISQAMIAVVASPRFLFREEGVQESTSKFAPIDEFSLASRLSYFLWSSMPDNELFELARKNKLRHSLSEQLTRMLAHSKSEEFVRNFVGQWLQTRDVDSASIDARQVLARETPPDPAFDRQRQRLRELRQKPESSLTPEEKKEMDEIRNSFGRRFGRPPRAELNSDLRRAFRQETEKTFQHIVREDRSLLELLDSDYTFLNERLATHYGLTNLNVLGDEMRLVKLPAKSPRGGVLTQGSVLVVTSNPTRTSPVKRGLFILDNLLGAPPPPPPPDIPPLEDAIKGRNERTFTLRETLALHREKPLCSSCHNRMDPVGLALENFNALGMWRDQERGQAVEVSGTLLSGESFTDIIELKRILAANHAVEFYRTVTEKLLTYALGRGLEYYDTQTVDQIVDQLVKTGGRPSVLLSGIVNSAAFQRSRSSDSNEPVQQRVSDNQRVGAKSL